MCWCFIVLEFGGECRVLIFGVVCAVWDERELLWIGQDLNKEKLCHSCM